MALAEFSMDAGEYLRIEAIDAAASSDPPWDDLTGASVSMSLRSWADASRVLGVNPSLDPASADGKIHGCGAEVPKTLPGGRYDGELLIDKDGAPGWPQVWQFTLSVRARPAG